MLIKAQRQTCRGYLCLEAEFIVVAEKEDSGEHRRDSACLCVSARETNALLCSMVQINNHMRLSNVHKLTSDCGNLCRNPARTFQSFDVTPFKMSL